MDICQINKSKIGYAYQHKYSLLVILKFMSIGIIKESYVDFPFESNLSLDLKVDLARQNTTNIYEIKSGEVFKDDKNEEMGNVLRHFFLYESILKKECRKFIIVAPEAKLKILEKWEDFLFIKENRRKNRSGETSKQVLERMRKDYGFRKLGVSELEFSNFIRSVNIELGPAYERDMPLGELTDLEGKIKEQVDDFCRALKVRSSNIEIPNWAVASELLHILHKCSERNAEAVCEIWKALLSCLRKRRLIKEARYKEDKEKVSDDLKEEVESFMILKTKLDYR